MLLLFGSDSVGIRTLNPIGLSCVLYSISFINLRRHIYDLLLKAVLHKVKTLQQLGDY